MIKVSDRLQIESAASGKVETALTVEMLKEHLRLKISSGGFTDPNTRVVKLLFDGEVITSTQFSVRQTREYEG